MEKKFEPVKWLLPAEEVKLVQSGDMELFKLYIAQHLLSKEAQMALFGNGNFEMLKAYIKVWPLCACAEVEMLKLRDLGIIDDYPYSLHPDAQVELVKMGNWELVKRYLNKFSFSSARAESHLLKCGDYDLLKWYMEKNYLHPNSEVKLVKLGNVQLIKDYIQLCPLSKAARLELGNLKEANLLEYHDKMWHI